MTEKKIHPDLVITEEQFNDALDYIEGVNRALLEIAQRFNNPVYTNAITVSVVRLHRTLKEMRELGYKNETKDT